MKGRIQALAQKGRFEGAEARIAGLARRAYLPNLGIHILFSLVRPTGRMKREATIDEKVEYAACLFRLGACREAKAILQSLPTAHSADIVFFTAGAEVREWNYDRAIPLWREFLVHPKANSYSRLVGKLNLAICLVFERLYPEAKGYLAEVLEESNSNEMLLLHANTLRQLGILELNRGNIAEAEDIFLQAKHLLRNSRGLDLYFCDKWIGISRFLKKPSNESAERDLLTLRKTGIEIAHWESVRDIDFRLAAEKNDKRLLEHLYFGTPFESFRRRLRRDGLINLLPPDYAWHLGGDGAPASSLDLFSDHENVSNGRKTGHLMYRLYRVLTSDFYRPFSGIELFERLFPDEKFSPRSSIVRVQQAVSRLRRILKAEKAPLLIKGKNTGFNLSASKPVKITVRLWEENKTGLNARFDLVRAKLGNEFSSSQIADLFDVTSRGAAIILKPAIEVGILERVGSGKFTRYRFLDNIKKAA